MCLNYIGVKFLDYVHFMRQDNFKSGAVQAQHCLQLQAKRIWFCCDFTPYTGECVGI